MQSLVVSGALTLALSLAPAAHADHKLTNSRESEAPLKVPESVRLDAKRKVLCVSNIDGESWNADGKGSIAKVGLDGNAKHGHRLQGRLVSHPAERSVIHSPNPPAASTSSPIHSAARKPETCLGGGD